MRARPRWEVSFVVRGWGMLAAEPVRHLSPNLLAHLRMPHALATLAAAGGCAVGLVAWRLVRRVEPDADAVEQARRQRLARVGRLTDGNLVDTTTLDGRYLVDAERADAMPRVLLYRYTVAGVGYEATQDVSGIGDLVRGVRVDLPIQVRYDAENPADSIVIAEEWCGVRLG